jgi:hypothetical protein
MKLTVASKKVSGQWEGALVVDGKFQRALVEPTLETLMQRGLSYLLFDNPEGTSVMIEVSKEKPGEPR